MAKGFRKLLFLGAVAGTIAGLYYFNKKKNESTEVPEEDEDLEDFEDDEEEKTTEKESFKDKERKYVNLAFGKAKSALEAAQRAVTRTEEYFNDEILGDKDKKDEPEVVADAEVTSTCSCEAGSSADSSDKTEEAAASCADAPLQEADDTASADDAKTE